jgi:hypothetical protein
MAVLSFSALSRVSEELDLLDPWLLSCQGPGSCPLSSRCIVETNSGTDSKMAPLEQCPEGFVDQLSIRTAHHRPIWGVTLTLSTATSQHRRHHCPVHRTPSSPAFQIADQSTSRRLLDLAPDLVPGRACVSLSNDDDMPGTPSFLTTGTGIFDSPHPARTRPRRHQTASDIPTLEYSKYLPRLTM